MIFNKKRNRPIAIDFGASTIKLMQVELGQPAKLLSACCVEMSEQERDNDPQRLDFYRSTLKRMLNAKMVKGRSAVISIPAHETIIQHFEIEGGSEDGIELEIQMRLEQRLEQDMSDFVIRTLSTNKRMREGKELTDVITVAVKKSTVYQYVSIAKSAGINVSDVVPEPSSICSMTNSQLENEHADKTQCTVDIGSLRARLMIHQGSNVLYFKNINIDHRLWQDNREVDSELQCEEPEIEPKNWSINQISQSGNDTQCSNEAVECLADEIQMCLRYYRSLYPQDVIKEITFTGGNSMQNEICKELAVRLGITVVISDPFKTLDLSELSKEKLIGLNADVPQPGWNVPIGMCMSLAG
ncbi:Competence protein A [Poriferisphaera corsica]|uniref:Competence protein A n=1 Tax=Poriferisphaera corsica TaxID=2528020 RepID=A0A517YUU1_9BACT|nr:pilus assembly protein PilM [Poriferisphaera corsica]QDU33976.1 Competence protein A [Poriferisphaera corsica]